jgi:hypothetical protein
MILSPVVYHRIPVSGPPTAVDAAQEQHVTADSHLCGVAHTCTPVTVCPSPYREVTASAHNPPTRGTERIIHVA